MRAVVAPITDKSGMPTYPAFVFFAFDFHSGLCQGLFAESGRIRFGNLLGCGASPTVGSVLVWMACERSWPGLRLRGE